MIGPISNRQGRVNSNVHVSDSNSRNLSLRKNTEKNENNISSIGNTNKLINTRKN